MKSKSLMFEMADLVVRPTKEGRPRIWGLTRPDLSEQSREPEPHEPENNPESSFYQPTVKTARNRAEADQIDVALSLDRAVSAGIPANKVAALAQSEKDALAGSWTLMVSACDFSVRAARYLVGNRLNAAAIHQDLKMLNWGWRGRGRPGINATTVAVDLINTFLMNQPDPSDSAADQRLRELRDELQQCNARLILRGSDRELAFRTGILSLALSRTLINNAVMRGQSLSQLPDDVSIEEPDRATLEQLMAAKRDGTLSDVWSLEELSFAISQFQRDGLQYPLAVAAIKSAVCLLPETMAAGVLAQSNLAYCALPAVGREVFLEEHLALREKLGRVDEEESTRLAALFPDLRIMDLDEVTEMVNFNITSFSLSVALIDVKDPVRRAELLGSAAEALGNIEGLVASKAAARNPKLRAARSDRVVYLRALVTSVARALSLSDTLDLDSGAYWASLGEQGAQDLLQQVEQHEFWDEVREVVRASAVAVYPGMRVTNT